MRFYENEALQEAYSRGFSNGYRLAMDEDFELDEGILDTVKSKMKQIKDKISFSLKAKLKLARICYDAFMKRFVANLAEETGKDENEVRKILTPVSSKIEKQFLGKVQKEIPINEAAGIVGLLEMMAYFMLILNVVVIAAGTAGAGLVSYGVWKLISKKSSKEAIEDCKKMNLDKAVAMA